MPPNVHTQPACATCRRTCRKCDRARPSCRRCIDKGLICGGYPDKYRFLGVANPGRGRRGRRAFEPLDSLGDDGRPPSTTAESSRHPAGEDADIMYAQRNEHQHPAADDTPLLPTSTVGKPAERIGSSTPDESTLSNLRQVLANSRTVVLLAYCKSPFLRRPSLCVIIPIITTAITAHN
jgi:hypothetical protein